MKNLSFNYKPPVLFSTGFPLTRPSEDSSGRSVLVQVVDPYEGLSADSFNLQAQLDAGVPLQHVSSVTPSSLGSVDKNNITAENYIDILNNKLNKSE